MARRWLAAEVGADPATVCFLGEGAWSRAFAYVDPGTGGARVARFGRQRDDFAKDRIAAAWAAPGVPVPAVHAIGSAFDGFVALSDRLTGSPLEALDESGWIAVLPSLFGVLDHFGAIDLPASKGWGLWDATGQAPHPTWSAVMDAVDADETNHRTQGWQAKLAASPTGDASFRALRARLAAIAEDPMVVEAPRAVVHSDLINRNVLVEAGRISGVFDWGSALFGDPLYDIAWFDFYAPWYPALEAIELTDRRLHHLERRDGQAPRGSSLRIHAAQLHIGLQAMAYCAHAGRDDDLAATEARIVTLVDAYR